MNNPNIPLPTLPSQSPVVSGLWSHPAVIAHTHFKNKSLSGWSFNTAIGCGHGCRFCYVPSVSTVKMASQLGPLGVADPDADWGNYVFLRPWDEAAFLKSLRHADKYYVKLESDYRQSRAKVAALEIEKDARDGAPPVDEEDERRS